MTTTSALTVTSAEDADVAEVIRLWKRAGLVREWNDPSDDIALARRQPNSTILLGRHDGALVASVLVGHDGHRGWVYYVSVDPDQRFRNFGRDIMTAAAPQPSCRITSRGARSCWCASCAIPLTQQATTIS